MHEYLRKLGVRDLDMVCRLIDHMADAEFVGLDTSTVRHNPRLQRLISLGARVPGAGPLWRAAASRAAACLGHRAHGIFRPERRRFAKGLALTLSALAALRTRGEDEVAARYAGTAARLFAWLEEKRLAPQRVWAHDYDYAINGVPVTVHTPNLITTAFVALAYWEWWTATGEEQALDTFLAIVRDMEETFPLYTYDGTGCFMYTPTTNLHVHNANLMMAELLARRHSRLQEADDRARITACVRYSLRDYERTGSFPYAGPPTEYSGYDNYHTGYVLRSLNAIRSFAPELGAELGLDMWISRGLDFYLGHFLWKGYVVRDRSRTMETHSTAEAILIDKTLGPWMRPEQRAAFRLAIARTAGRLWNARGWYFNHTVSRALGGLLAVTDRSDLVRWSQAWMAFALAKEEAA